MGVLGSISKNFLNICHNEQDFAVKCTWSFFATIHGKSPCDGIGGTVKRLTAIASLHRTTNNHILTASSMFDFCKNEIKGVKFYFISKESDLKIRSEMEHRYNLARILPGTRSYHNFTPISKTKIGTKVVSEQEEYSFVFNFQADDFDKENLFTQINLAEFVCSIYDNVPWIGVVEEIDIENKDFQVKFMHPSYPSRSYHWPSQDDVCWVPSTNLLLKVDTPMTVTGRQYNISEIEHKHIKDSWKKFKPEN